MQGIGGGLWSAHQPMHVREEGRCVVTRTVVVRLPERTVLSKRASELAEHPPRQRVIECKDERPADGRLRRVPRRL